MKTFAADSVHSNVSYAVVHVFFWVLFFVVFFCLSSILPFAVSKLGVGHSRNTYSCQGANKTCVHAYAESAFLVAYRKSICVSKLGAGWQRVFITSIIFKEGCANV